MADEVETKRYSVTYTDRDDEAPRVEYLGKRFYHGQAVVCELTPAQLAKIEGNPWFEAEELEGELPLEPAKPAKPAKADAWGKGAAVPAPVPVKAK